MTDFRIADTFTDSLARLTGDEQKAVKTTAFDLQINPANPGMSFHKLDKAKDKNFWSVRVGSDIRLIVHKSDATLLLCYVDHHDKAYDWAERRKLETHPQTGAAQLVEIRETVKEIIVPVYVHAEIILAPKPAVAINPLFADRSDNELLSYGVPSEWLGDVKSAKEDTLLALAWTWHVEIEPARCPCEAERLGIRCRGLQLCGADDPEDTALTTRQRIDRDCHFAVRWIERHWLPRHAVVGTEQHDDRRILARMARVHANHEGCLTPLGPVH